MVESELQCIAVPGFLKDVLLQLPEQKDEDTLCADRKKETLKSLDGRRRITFLATFMFVCCFFLKKERSDVPYTARHGSSTYLPSCVVLDAGSDRKVPSC